MKAEGMSEENTENLVLEHLRAIREGQTKILDRLANVEKEIISLRKQVHDLQGDSIRRDQTMAALSINVDRINSRLELNDA